jgi:hypothetical protein
MPESNVILQISFCGKLFLTIFTNKFSQLMMDNVHVRLQVCALRKFFVTKVAFIVSYLEVSFIGVTFKITFFVEHFFAVIAFEALNSSMFGLEMSGQVTHLKKVLRTFLKKNIMVFHFATRFGC